jgi:hypothetical protein
MRDIVRIVEVLNLRAQWLFNTRSVLSGSMAQLGGRRRGRSVGGRQADGVIYETYLVE